MEKFLTNFGIYMTFATLLILGLFLNFVEIEPLHLPCISQLLAVITSYISRFLPELLEPLPGACHVISGSFISL